MKKIILLLSVVMLSMMACAEYATISVVGKNPPTTCMSEWTPLKLTIAGPVALPPGFWDVKGLEIGIWNWTDEQEIRKEQTRSAFGL